MDTSDKDCKHFVSLEVFKISIILLLMSSLCSLLSPLPLFILYSVLVPPYPNIHRMCSLTIFRASTDSIIACDCICLDALYMPTASENES